MRWRTQLAGIAAILAAILAAVTALLLVTSRAAEISGHVYHCDGGRASAAARQCAPGEPVANLILRFDQIGGSRSYTATTSANGSYTVRVEPGTFVVLSEIDGTAEAGDPGKIYVSEWRTTPITVAPGQHLVLDLTSHTVTQ